MISQSRWNVFSRTLNNISNVNQSSEPELPVLASLWLYITWDNTDQKSHHVGKKHVGGGGQKEAHDDKDHGQERHPQGQDTEPTGAADPTVSCNKKKNQFIIIGRQEAVGYLIWKL